MANQLKLNSTVLELAKKHFGQGAFGVATLAEAIGVHFTTVHRWIKRGQGVLAKPPEERSEQEQLYADLAEIKSDPPAVYSAAWKAILDELNRPDPDLALAKWVIEHFDEGHLAKLELQLAQGNEEK